MKAAIAELKDRNYSILRLLEHVEHVSQPRGNIEVIVGLKSSVFIAIYNNIEATIYSVIERIHYNYSHLTYDELPEPLKKKMLLYSFGKEQSQNINNQARVSEKENIYKHEKTKFPNLSDYLRKQSIFSGNIDVRKLKEIWTSYGMSLPAVKEKDADRMLWVKNKRNKIAHGEQSMTEGGQGIKTVDLCEAYKSVNAILNSFILTAISSFDKNETL